MSEIKRYGVWDKPPREDLVTYADHEAAIEQAYSDGESSGAADWQLKIIEVIERHDTGGIMSPDAEGIMGDLRALTQPQAEGRPGYPLDEDGDGKGVPMFADEGAATAADADLAEQVDDEWRGKVIDLADELDAEGKKDVAERVFALTLAFANTEPGPYAKAFREKFPVPEFPGIKNRQEDQA